MTHYETLGVTEAATPEELKSAFRKLAKTHHPDLGGDIQKFQQINEAYETLSDPDKRAHYNHQLRNPHQQNPFANNMHPGNPFEFHFNMGGGNPFDFQDQIFQQFGFNVRQPARNRNIRIQLEVDLLSTLHKQTKVVEYKTSNATETLQIELPPGINDGTAFNIQGRGDDSNPSIPRGNLEVVVKVLANSRYFRSGDNLFEDITIDCFQAIMGCKKTLHLPSGKQIELNIPAGTQHQAQFGVTDEGFDRNNGTTGKYVARINVLIPTALTTDQLNLIAQIQQIRPVNT